MARRSTKTAAAEADAGQDESVLGDMLDALNRKDSGTPTFRLSDDGLSIHLPGVIPTGSEALDHALGRGGIPQSRITLISGDEGTGKTTLGLQLCAACQRIGGIANYIDAEYKVEREYAGSLGVNNDRLLLSQPESMEDALESIDTVLSVAARHDSKRPILIVLDSLNALPPRAELEGVDTPGASARVMAKGLRKINRRISKQRVALVLISQLRNKIGGVMFGKRDPVTEEESYSSMDLVRLAIPRRVYTQSHVDYLAEVVLETYSKREGIRGLKFEWQAPFLRHFTARFVPSQ